MIGRETEPEGDLSPGPRILMGPGPTMAEPRVLRAMCAPLLGQFDPDFTRIMNEVMDLRRFLFQRPNALEQVLRRQGWRAGPGAGAPADADVGDSLGARGTGRH